MKIATKIKITVDVGLMPVFKFLASDDVLPKILVGTAFLPRVIKTTELKGKWDTPGSTRKVTLKGGDTAREKLLDFIDNSYFEYKVSDYTFILKYLSKYAIGKWWFKENSSNKTEIMWEYSFYPINFLAYIPTLIFAKLLWKSYMESCMIAIKSQVEEMNRYDTL